MSHLSTSKRDSISIQCNRPSDCLNEGLDLEAQTKEFLIERVLVLERQLRIRNRDCARLLQERHELQQSPHGVAHEPQNDRARELEREVEELRRRNRELNSELARRCEDNSAVQHSRPQSPSKYGNRVTIFNTEMGPQVIYDSGVSLDESLRGGSSPSYGYPAPRSSSHGGYRNGMDDEARLQAKLQSM